MNVLRVSWKEEGRARWMSLKRTLNWFTIAWSRRVGAHTVSFYTELPIRESGLINFLCI